MLMQVSRGVAGAEQGIEVMYRVLRSLLLSCLLIHISADLDCGPSHEIVNWIARPVL